MHSREIDLTGRRVHSLTVLRRTEERRASRIMWECLCDCGEITLVGAQSLRDERTKSCGCAQKGATPKDITGQRNGKLVAVSNTGEKCSNRDYKWNFVCDCGNTRVLSLGMFSSKYNLSCKECAKERVSSIHRTHGFKQSHKTYKAWLKIRERCYNPNDKSYSNYGGAGIKMSDMFYSDFMNFYNEVGEAPKGARYSVDRKDHTKGYVEGNLRWATDDQQARNRGKHKNNSSGVTGVRWDNKKDKKGSSVLYATGVVNQRNDNGVMKMLKKSFRVDKLGLLESFALACSFRESKIQELNSLGYGYSDNHGK